MFRYVSLLFLPAISTVGPLSLLNCRVKKPHIVYHRLLSGGSVHAAQEAAEDVQVEEVSAGRAR